MLLITERQKQDYGEMWLTKINRKQWQWLFMELPYLVMHDQLMGSLGHAMQTSSDLDLTTLPQYICKIPAVTFYPYTTSVVREWFGQPFGPTFIIPYEPLNRLQGRYWFQSLTNSPLDLLQHKPNGLKHGWIKPDGTEYTGDGWPMDYLTFKRLAIAAESIFLDDIRYVYDEVKRSKDQWKTNTPTRHQFTPKVSSFEATQAYLEWYLQLLYLFTAFDETVI